MTIDGNPGRFNLLGGYPAATLGLQAKIPESQGVAPGGQTSPSALHDFAMFNAFGTQHNLSLITN
jgi:hypothetical protein